jgi:proline racemase/trans-L-3-hydroxyproline dehydratase
MLNTNFEEAFRQTFDDTLLCIDSHVGGEPARLVVGGLPLISGGTTNDKRLYLSENLDQIRLLTTREPRGHRDMFASILVEPESNDADFGLVYMDARRYPYLCGHATIAAVSAMIELGLLEAAIPETRVVVDTPSGSWETVAQVRKNISPDGRRFRVESVAIRPEIAFAFLLDQPLQVPNLGSIQVDVSFTGGFFVMVSAEQIDLELSVENAPQLARLGMDIIEAGNAQLEVQHPQREYINTIDVVEFFDPRGHEDGRGKNFVVLGEGHVDRSPCGTGTCAKLALLHKRKQLQVGETFVNEGLLGTTFDAHIVRESSIKNPKTGENLPAIVPEISGAAHITGLQYFVLTPEDPFPEGFLIQA